MLRGLIVIVVQGATKVLTLDPTPGETKVQVPDLIPGETSVLILELTVPAISQFNLECLLFNILPINRGFLEADSLG